MSGQALATAGRFIGAAVDGNALYNSADMAFQTLLYLEPGAGG